MSLAIPTVQVTLDLTWLNLVIAMLLPMLVDLVVKKVAPPRLKSTALLFLAAVGASLTEIYNAGGVFDLATAAINTVIMFVVAVAAHFGYWKPQAVTGKDGFIQRVLPGGVGGA